MSETSTTTAPTRSPARALGPERLRVVAYWVVSAPVLAETAVGIQWDLARIPYVLDVLDRLGFPHYFATILGISKILALVALLLPRTPRLKEWAYAGLTFVYAGAAACHVAVGDELGAVLTPLVLAAITLASWALRPPSRRDPRPLFTTWPSGRGA
jgi:apolipoprotein N-acyltransferase